MKRIICSFTGEYEFLSVNYVELDGLSVQHRFQASKTHFMEEKNRILMAKTPKKAWELGQKCYLRDDWKYRRIELMRYFNYMKFTEDTVLLNKLVNTGDNLIVVSGTPRDTFWCVYGNYGENMLGRILMEVREGVRDGTDINVRG